VQGQLVLILLFILNISEFDEYPEVEETLGNMTQAKKSSTKPAKNEFVDKEGALNEAFVNEQTAVIDVNDDDAGLNANVELDDSETRQQMAGSYTAQTHNSA